MRRGCERERVDHVLVLRQAPRCRVVGDMGETGVGSMKRSPKNTRMASEVTKRYGHPDKSAALSPLSSRTQSRLVRFRLFNRPRGVSAAVSRSGQASSARGVLKAGLASEPWAVSGAYLSCPESHQALGEQAAMSVLDRAIGRNTSPDRSNVTYAFPSTLRTRSVTYAFP